MEGRGKENDRLHFRTSGAGSEEPVRTEFNVFEMFWGFN